MSRATILAVVLGAGVVAIGVYVAAWTTYRGYKLKALEPRSIERPIQWSGDPLAPCRLLLVGDSRIDRWALAPREGWRVGQLGYPGETTPNIANAASAPIRDAQADVVVVQSGGNDATAAAFQSGAERRKTLDAAAASIGDIVDAAHAAGAERVYVLNLVPPIRLELWKRALYGTRLTRLMLELGDRIEQVTMARNAETIDANRFFRDEQGELRVAYRADGIHWSDAAYRDLGGMLWDRIGACPRHSGADSVPRR